MAKEKKKTAPKKEAKPRAEHYEPKVSINGSFADVIGVAVGKNQANKDIKKQNGG